MLQLKKLNYLDFLPHPIVGVDEVGRGCIAGPVYAAAVSFKKIEPSVNKNENEYVIQSAEMHATKENSFGFLFSQLTDSKLLSEKRREELAPLILNHHFVGIGSASVEEIDQINILQASLLAMKRAIENLEKQMGMASGHILIDGNQKIKNLDRKQTTLIKGDLICAPISAASIVAKVTRDHQMREYAKIWPQYGFESHKGYGSKSHRELIKVHGPSSCHRKTFKGVREYL